MARVLVIPDMHHPFSHPKSLDHLKRMEERYQTQRVICLGDEIDAAAFSVKYALNPDLPSANDELSMAIEKLQPFYEHFKEVDVCESNHQARIFKKVRVSGLPSKVVKRYQEIMGFPEGWHLVPKQIVDDVHYIHGDPFNKSSWRLAHEKMKVSVAMGHHHSCPGVVYSSTTKKIFSANFGCLINPAMPAFDYSRNTIERAVLGCGVIIDGEVAIFEPMPSKWL